MKRILLVVFSFCALHVLAQTAPQKMSYQAVARNSAGTIVANQAIKIKVEIVDADLTTVRYSETHAANTNQFGLFTLQVGTGTIISGVFSDITWAVGDKYIRTSVDLTGGSAYQLMGMSQLLTVPYAFYAEKTKLVAGTGINITNGNTINATGTGSQWANVNNGISYSSGKVGIGVAPSSVYPLSVFKQNSGLGEAIADFKSNDTWHSAIYLGNTSTTPAQGFAFVVGGVNNIELKPNNLGIFNGVNAKWPFTIGGSNNYIGIGDTTFYPTVPKATLHIKTGDVYLEQIAKGIIMKSPNGNCWRITIDDAGNLVRTAITCP